MSIFFRIICTGFICLLTIHVAGQERKEYIEKYKSTAIKEMHRTGIPASIKLAQGILESACGRSELARKANNHFGIKCHDWKGPSHLFDDDAKNECFRKYKHAEDSWLDHSKFLQSRPHYASLFKIHHTDYKKWAYGLKAAGYATNPKYAELLIKIIEDEGLYKYDRSSAKAGKKEYTGHGTGAENYFKREEIINGVKCIKIQAGDSFEKIAAYYGIKLKKLLAYNDKKDNKLIAGQYVFIGKKKSKAARGYDYHRIAAHENIYLISQKYGVQVNSLIKFNHLNGNTRLVVGEKIYLRKKVKI